MFYDMPQAVLDQMQLLEAADANDRQDGTPRSQRLRQVPPETGKFISLMAAGAPEGNIIEIGTSAGYSTLWLAVAGRVVGRNITTFELLPEKIARAQETFKRAGVEANVKLVAGDAREHLGQIARIAFCFLDAEKEVYGDCYNLIIPNLVQGGILLADNAINHQHILQPMLDRALADHRVDSLIIPIGKGVLLCRKN